MIRKNTLDPSEKNLYRKITGVTEEKLKRVIFKKIGNNLKDLMQSIQ